MFQHSFINFFLAIVNFYQNNVSPGFMFEDMVLAEVSLLSDNYATASGAFTGHKDGNKVIQYG